MPISELDKDFATKNNICPVCKILSKSIHAFGCYRSDTLTHKQTFTPLSLSKRILLTCPTIMQRIGLNNNRMGHSFQYRMGSSSHSLTTFNIFGADDLTLLPGKILKNFAPIYESLFFNRFL